MILSRKELARIKLENLKMGYSAFTDSEEIASIMKRQINTLDMPIHIDQTTLGCWFIPERTTHEACPENSFTSG